MGSLSAASSATYTTFEAFSEGCSGGGDVCGTFPLIPSGSAEYSHSAGPDGTLDLAASTDGGLPLAMCLPAACPPGQYHAEALGSVWVDVDTPDGTQSLAIAADYRLDELVATAEATLGGPVVSVAGALTAIEAPDAPAAVCSDGSSVVGRAVMAIDETSAVGPGTLATTIACEGASGTLSATRWRLELSIALQATSDGGTADTRARARLVAVHVEASL